MCLYVCVGGWVRGTACLQYNMDFSGASGANFHVFKVNTGSDAYLESEYAQSLVALSAAATAAGLFPAVGSSGALQTRVCIVLWTSSTCHHPA